MSRGTGQIANSVHEYIIDFREQFHTYLMYLDQCGWSDCKGLGIRCAKDEGTNLFQTYLYNILRFLPGSRQGVVAEAWAVYEAIKSGEIIVNKNQINLDALGEWIVQFVEKGVN